MPPTADIPIESIAALANMPSEALYNVYFRAKGDATDKQAYNRVYAFAMKNKKYYMDYDNDIREGFNLSPVLGKDEINLEQKVIEMFSPVLEAQEQESKQESKFTIESARDYIKSKKKITGKDAIKILSDLGKSTKGLKADEARQSVLELMNPKPEPAKPVPSNILIQSFDETSSDEDTNEQYIADELLIIRTELESSRRYADMIGDIVITVVKELLLEVKALREFICKPTEVKNEPPPTTTNKEQDYKVEAKSREKIPILHTSTKGLRLSNLDIKPDEKVCFDIKKSDGTYNTYVCNIGLSGIIELPNDIEFAERYVYSPSTALKFLKQLMVKQGKRENIGSKTEDGWRAGYILRDSKKVRLISIPLKQ